MVQLELQFLEETTWAPRVDHALGIMDAPASRQIYLAEENCLMIW